MIIHTLSLTTIYLVVFHGNALQYGDRQEPLFKSVTSIAKKSNNHENRVQILGTKYHHDRVFGPINNSPSFSSPSSFIVNSNPVSLTIAMKLQPKRRYRKLKLPGVEGGSDDVTNPIILPSHQVNSAVGLLLKRTGHLNEISSSRTRKPKYRVSSISVPSSKVKGTNRQQSALAKFEIRKQKTGLQSKPTEPTLLPIKLTSERPPAPRNFHSNGKSKVKLDKKSISLVGSLITAPPSDKSKLTIPKPLVDWSDRRHIQSNRPASSMAANRRKPTAGNDEIPSSSKKREFLYTGKVRSTTPLSIQFEIKKPSYNHKVNLIKEQTNPPVNAVKNLGNHGTVLLASGQLGQINKSKITRIPLEPLDYETELDKNHADNGMDRHKQLSPYEMTPFAYIEAVSENVENNSDSISYFARTPENQMTQTEKSISKPNENMHVTPPTSTDYSGYKRRSGIKDHNIQIKYELPPKPVSGSTESRRNNKIKYDYGHFGERMVPLRSSDLTSTTTTTTTTTESPIIVETNQPTEPSNVYFENNVTPNSNEGLDSELETVKENDIDGQVTGSTVDPLIEGNFITGSTATPWAWDDTASENDGLLVSPLFASANDDDMANHEIQRNQHQESTTASYYAAEQPIEESNQANSANQRTSFTKSPDSGDSNGSETTRYYFPFELKYLAELCKNNSAFGLSSFPSTTTSTSTTTPMPTTESVEELTLEKSQVDQATLSYGDRPFAIGSIRGQKNGYNMKKVAYQYKQWGDQWIRSSKSNTVSQNERRQRKLTSPSLDGFKTQVTTIAPDDYAFFDLTTLKPPTEESSDIKNEEAMKTVRPILKQEYRYEAPFPDHGSHGEPIGANLFEEIDLKATETTDPDDSHPSSDKLNVGVSFDEDKHIFENFDSEMPVSRIRPDEPINEPINNKQPKNPKIKKLNQKSSETPVVAPTSEPKAVQSSPKRYPSSKTLQNSGGLSSSILDELAGIPGGAGRDYPALPKIPEEIEFSCKGRASGFYADMNLRCQVYHHCNHGSMQSFMCPNGTIFNQEISVCSWWFNVDCGKSEQFYQLNNKPAPEPTKPPKPISINVSEAANTSSRRPKKNRIIYKQTPALEESFFREKPRSYSTTSNTFYINRNRRRHRYHHHHNRDDMFPFF